MDQEYVPWPLRTGWWWAAHVLSAVFAIVVALHLVSGDRPPPAPGGWLRLDLMLLLIVVFFATVTRQVDQIHHQRTINIMSSPTFRLLYHGPDLGEPGEDAPATPAPATAP